jgi:thioredoxin-dependent peroxiredoxin
LSGKFKKAKAIIVGISPDTVASHEKFKKKMSFTFELLSDVDQKVCKLYDVIQEKSMYGKKYLGVERSTFLIDGKGVLRHEWRKVKVKGHAEAVLAAVTEL